MAGERQLHGLGVDHCEGSIAPDEVLKVITVRDEEGGEVAHTTVLSDETPR